MRFLRKMRSLARCERLIFYVSPRYSEKRPPSAKSSLPLFDSGFSLRVFIETTVILCSFGGNSSLYEEKTCRKIKHFPVQLIDAIIISISVKLFSGS
jgi:hypothetical protein